MSKSLQLKIKDLKVWDVQAEAELLKHFAPLDFWTFFQWVFGAQTNPKGARWIDYEVHEPMARWFQKHVDEWFAERAIGAGRQKHIAALVHREVGKTTMLVQAGICWLHLRDPEISTYIGSEKLELASKSLNAIKAVFDGSDPYPLFSKFFGNWSVGSRKWTDKEIIHTARKNISRRDPSIGTFAVETSIVGAHPDAIFYDDPISYERLQSDTNWLATVNSQITSLYPVIQSDGLVVWVGTRYDDADHFGVAFENEGVASVEGLPTDQITIDPKGQWHVYFMAGRDAEQRPTTPKVWPEDRLKRYQRRDPLRYAAQVMNDPTLSDTNPLTREQIRQYAIKKEDVPWSALRYAICCDTAFSDGEKVHGKDETVFIVHGYPRNGSGDVYIIEGYGSHAWRAEDFANQLVSLVQRYRRMGRSIFAITDEMTHAGKKGAWDMALQSRFADANVPFPRGQLLQFNRRSVQKEQRLVTAASFWVDGHVRYIEDAPGAERIVEQMSKIGQYMVNKKVKIDWADAHADAFQPELYSPMRRPAPKSPYLEDARGIEMEGLDHGTFNDSDYWQWREENPRLPEKSG